MHPEVIKDKPGSCMTCGMNLAKAETLGFTPKSHKHTKPLIIPETAPLITGKRAVVYIESIQNDKLTYEGREITLGPKLDGFYMVKRGLKEGEKVVIKGNFKIDSALQILAKKSMMGEAVVKVPMHHHGGQQMSYQKMKSSMSHQKSGSSDALPAEFKKKIKDALENYFKLQANLTINDFSKAQKQADLFVQKVSQVSMKGLTGSVHINWMQVLTKFKTIHPQIGQTKNLDNLRWIFYQLSQYIENLFKDVMKHSNINIYKFYCPMAFDYHGAIWFQNHKKLQNPYFRQQMLGCGEEQAMTKE